MTVAIVVLAAGASTRYGRPKQRELLPEVLDALARTPVDQVVVVAGAHTLDLSGLPHTTLVTADEWARGPGASLRRGLAELGPNVTHALIVLADGPRLDPAAIARVIEGRELGPVVAAAYDGVRSHPVSLARAIWREIPDDGARALTPVLVDCSDLRPPGDIDYPADDLVVAAAQPNCFAFDLAANAAEHAAAVRAAAARIVAFPELSLTGYELAAEPVALDDPLLEPLVEACAATGTIAFAGAPVRAGDGSIRIATLEIDRDGVEVVYTKTHLGGDESRRFTSGEGPAVAEIDGRRVGFGICKDTGVDEHHRAVAASNIDVYIAGLVHHPEELAEQYRRGERIAAATNAYVVFASCAAPTGGGYAQTAGHSTIWNPDGVVLADAGAAVGQLAIARVRASTG